MQNFDKTCHNLQNYNGTEVPERLTARHHKDRQQGSSSSLSQTASSVLQNIQNTSSNPSSQSGHNNMHSAQQQSQQITGNLTLKSGFNRQSSFNENEQQHSAQNTNPSMQNQSQHPIPPPHQQGYSSDQQKQDSIVTSSSRNRINHGVLPPNPPQQQLGDFSSRYIQPAYDLFFQLHNKLDQDLAARLSGQIPLEEKKEKILKYESSVIFGFLKAIFSAVFQSNVDLKSELADLQNTQKIMSASVGSTAANQDSIEEITCKYCKEYEQQLQKLEAEIRQHIRTQRQLEIHAENVQDRVEEQSKQIKKLEGMLEASQADTSKLIAERDILSDQLSAMKVRDYHTKSKNNLENPRSSQQVNNTSQQQYDSQDSMKSQNITAALRIQPFPSAQHGFPQSGQTVLMNDSLTNQLSYESHPTKQKLGKEQIPSKRNTSSSSSSSMPKRSNSSNNFHQGNYMHNSNNTSNENANKSITILNQNGVILQQDTTSVPQSTNRILSTNHNNSNIIMNAQSIHIGSSDKENSVFSSQAIEELSSKSEELLRIQEKLRALQKISEKQLRNPQSASISGHPLREGSIEQTSQRAVLTEENGTARAHLKHLIGGMQGQQQSEKSLFQQQRYHKGSASQQMNDVHRAKANNSRDHNVQESHNNNSKDGSFCHNNTSTSTSNNNNKPASHNISISNLNKSNIISATASQKAFGNESNQQHQAQQVPLPKNKIPKSSASQQQQQQITHLSYHIPNTNTNSSQAPHSTTDSNSSKFIHTTRINNQPYLPQGNPIQFNSSIDNNKHNNSVHLSEADNSNQRGNNSHGMVSSTSQGNKIPGQVHGKQPSNNNNNNNNNNNSAYISSSSTQPVYLSKGASSHSHSSSQHNFNTSGYILKNSTLPLASLSFRQADQRQQEEEQFVQKADDRQDYQQKNASVVSSNITARGGTNESDSNRAEQIGKQTSSSSSSSRQLNSNNSSGVLTQQTRHNSNNTNTTQNNQKKLLAFMNSPRFNKDEESTARSHSMDGSSLSYRNLQNSKTNQQQSSQNSLVNRIAPSSQDTVNSGELRKNATSKHSFYQQTINYQQNVPSDNNSSKIISAHNRSHC